MLYIAQLAGIHAIRILLPAAAKLLTSKQVTPPPKPHRTVHVERPTTNGKGGGRKVRCDIYLPSAVPRDDDGGSDAPLPVVLNLHGAGFTLHTMGDDARFCQEIAEQLPCAVVDVEYSKAPEAPYPNANVDIDAVLAWLWDGDAVSLDDAFRLPNSKVANVERGRIALTGFSSGGNLALTAAVRAHKQGKLERIAAIVAFYPSTNLSESPWSKPKVKPDAGAAGGVMPPAVRAFFYDCYVNDAKHSAGSPDFPPRTSPLISPLYADAQAFPHSTTIITCSGDSLGREGRQLAEHIVAGRTGDAAAERGDTDAGARAEPPVDVADVERVAVRHNAEQAGVLWWEAEGQGHAWDKMTKPGSKPDEFRQQAYTLTIERLRAAFASSSSSFKL